MNYNIISSGSQGNAVIINEQIMVDCGVSYKAIKPYIKSLKLVLLTHRHGDHFNKATIKRLADDRPTLRFACCEWLVPELSLIAKKIDVLEVDKIYDYNWFSLSPFWLHHNVPNCGYRLFIDNEKLFYATDTAHLDGIEAKGYDLYMIEANHMEEEITKRTNDKLESGEYAYEISAMLNHLSKEQADNFIYSNIAPNGQYVYLHTHKGIDFFEVKQ